MQPRHQQPENRRPNPCAPQPQTGTTGQAGGRAGHSPRGKLSRPSDQSGSVDPGAPSKGRMPGGVPAQAWKWAPPKQLWEQVIDLQRRPQSCDPVHQAGQGRGGRQASCPDDPPPGGEPARAQNDQSGRSTEAQSPQTKTKVRQKAGAEGNQAWDEGRRRQRCRSPPCT
jgi:hypothetical protein